MKNTLEISPKDMINAFLLFFVITTCQTGVGIQGFQRLIYADAKHDAWISVILAGLSSHIIVFFMIKTLELYGSNDLYGIHQDLFGKHLGNLLNFIYILYCSVAFFLILENYIEVISTWVFPRLNPKFISISLLLLVIYTFLGGLRVIVGVSFFSFLLGLWLLPVLIFPLKFSNIEYLLPILDTDIISILKGAQSMTFTIIGFEIINIIYPFVKEKDKVKRHVHLGLLVTSFIYLTVMLITLTYFSGEQLAKTIWATLSLFSIIRLPFIERIEFITICFWLIIILPNLCFYLWAAYRGSIRLFNVSSKKFVWIFSTIIFIFSLFVQTRIQINTYTTYLSKVAFILVFIYPVVLYILALMKKKFSGKYGEKNE
ncbi:GerAB/ArcD/ProY family transporter [Psychrobacillus sp. FJAT-51614]|uniref:GerAB/ArcD/ProY family transporter n=1 Tax=Psychrobacillus mangrovi TaxID=3117745 RepID=A0ABU8F272_9BACI